MPTMEEEDGLQSRGDKMDLLNLIEHAWVEYDNGFGNLNGEF